MMSATVGQFVMDALESRSMLSVAPMATMVPSLAEPAALVQPLAAKAGLAKIAGKYSGTVVVTGVHTRPINVTIKEAANGTLSGTLTTPLDNSIRVKVGGKVTSKSKFTFTLANGTHSGGAIAGSGTGAVKGTKLSIKFTFVQGTSNFPGTLSLTKV